MDNNGLVFHNYLVVFFDLLGQREALRKITGIPVSATEEELFIELTRKSIGRVLKLRDGFKDFFEGMLSHEPNIELVPPAHKEEFIESQKVTLLHYGLSDAIVIAVPLTNENENCTSINGIFSALTATCAIMLLALSLKIPARAGIDVGVGVQIDEQEIYGPALEGAFRIEAQLAEYPRLVVGRKLFAYLNVVENQESQTNLGKIASMMAKQCKKLMLQDTDGRIILDYLGNNIEEVFENKIDKEIVLNAWNYVEEQHRKHIKMKNDKLSARYFRMRRYFKPRLHLWGIEQESERVTS